MFYNLGKINDKYAVLDTEDFATDLLSSQEVKHCSDLGFKITKFERSSVILRSNENKFQLSLYGSSKVLYSGKFPTHNDRGDFFGSDMHISNVARFKNYILVEVRESVWCKYDIEIPMFMFQVIGLPIKNIKNTFLSFYTSNALTSADSIHEFDSMYGDAPTDCCIPCNLGRNKYYEDKIKILGVDYTDIQYYEDICKKVEYLKD